LIGTSIPFFSTHLQQLAALEALRNQQQNLEETIGRLQAIMKKLPDGEARDMLLEEISALDVIAETMGQALESCKKQ
jgi:Tfp pilus assembly protein PilO